MQAAQVVKDTALHTLIQTQSYKPTQHGPLQTLQARFVPQGVVHHWTQGSRVLISNCCCRYQHFSTSLILLTNILQVRGWFEESLKNRDVAFLKFYVEFMYTSKIKKGEVYICAAGVSWNKSAIIQSDCSTDRLCCVTKHKHPKKRIHTAMAFKSFDKHLSNLSDRLLRHQEWLGLPSCGGRTARPMPGL